MSDEELAQAAAGGNDDAFAELVNRYDLRLKRYIKAFVSRVSGPIQDYESAVQEVWIKVYAALRAGQYKKMKDAFSGWLFLIADRTSIDHLRRQNRRIQTESYPFDVKNRQTDRTADLVCAMDSLPIHQRQVFVLRLVYRMTTMETAAWLGVSEDAVKKRLQSARTHVIVLLQDDSLDDTNHTCRPLEIATPGNDDPDQCHCQSMAELCGAVSEDEAEE